MEARTSGRNRISVVVDSGTATVVVDGESIALPPKEFILLSELASRAGGAVASSVLIERVWEGRPGMTLTDLHALVRRLRVRIGDQREDARIIVNRKGMGYLIDTRVADVSFASAASLEPALAGAAEQGAVDLGAVVGSDPAPAAASGSREVAARFVAESESRRARFLRSKSLGWWAAAAVVVAAFGVVGFLGGAASNDDEAPAAKGSVASQAPATPPRQERHRNARPEKDARRPRPDRPRRSRQSRTGPVVAAAPPVSGSAPQPAAAPATSAPRRETNKRQPVELPAPPTRYLYHLYNAENGDHFVTTDGGAVTEHEAKGYEGGAIGRVYVTPEKNTQAIALNYGSAFVFMDASPKTNPASTTLPLWLAKNNGGDFFYTTSKSEASAGEWSGTLIGYVRSL